MKKDTYITVRMSKELKDKITVLLKKNGLTHSKYINYLYNEAVENDMKKKETT